MCTYTSLVPFGTRNYIHYRLSSPWTVFTDVINDLLDTYTVHIMLNIEPQIEKIFCHLWLGTFGN